MHDEMGLNKRFNEIYYPENDNDLSESLMEREAKMREENENDN